MGGGGKTAKSTGAMPWWVQGPHKALIDKAENFAYGAEGDYVPYGNDRIAGLDPRSEAANQAREAMFNRGDEAGQFAADQYSKSAGLTDQVWDVANSEFGQEDYASRMNPYQQNVTDMGLREANQSFDRRVNQDQAKSVARGGSIGSYRVGLENAFLESERGKTLGDIQNQGSLDNYNQAQQSFYGDRDAKLRGLGEGAAAYNATGAGANQLGTDSMAREQSLINEMDRAGAINQEMEQKHLNLAYDDFKEEQNWPRENMGWLSTILSGVPTQGLGTQTTFNPGPGTASQVAGFGLSAAALAQYS